MTNAEKFKTAEERRVETLQEEESEMKNIMGRESIHKQCYECANCEPPKIKTGGSRFHCAFLNKEFGTWHYDVPTECPCGGRGWNPKK